MNSMSRWLRTGAFGTRDEYYTPKILTDVIVPFIPPGKIVWCPFDTTDSEFVHRHQDCRLARMPKSRVAYWREKLEANKRRDDENVRRLNELGWRVLVVWECQIKEKDLNEISNVVRRFLADGTGGEHDEIG